MRERIIAFLEAINIGSSQFAEEIGVQPSGISHILSGRNNPSLDFVLKVLKRYPDLSTEWLLFGKGNMHGIVADEFPENMNIIENAIVNSDAIPEYKQGQFAGIESDNSRSAETAGAGDSGKVRAREAQTEKDMRQQAPTYPIHNQHNDGEGVSMTSAKTAKTAKTLILVYEDGTFEQFSLRHASDMIPIPVREK